MGGFLFEGREAIRVVDEVAFIKHSPGGAEGRVVVAPYKHNADNSGYLLRARRLPSFLAHEGWGGGEVGANGGEVEGRDAGDESLL